MQGELNFTGTLAGSIADSGGGGSTVTITPKLESGTKIADYSIDGKEGSLYAPTPEGLTAQLPLSISNGVISIDLSDYMTETEIYTYFAEKSYVNNMFQSMSRDLQENYQKKLVAGTGISIDSITNTISCTASGGGVNYSTSEQDTGIEWTDGRHIFQKTIVINNFSFSSQVGSFYYGSITVSDYISNCDMIWVDVMHSFIEISGVIRNFVFYENGLDSDEVLLFNYTPRNNVKLTLTVQYLKSV